MERVPSAAAPSNRAAVGIGAGLFASPVRTADGFGDLVSTALGQPASLRRLHEWRETCAEMADALWPRLIPLHQGVKRPYRLREGGFRWGEIGAATERLLVQWTTKFPDADWGLRTGEIPDIEGNLLVSDVDKPELAPVPPAVDWDRYFLLATTRGYHAYGLAAPGEVRGRRHPWGEVKAQGGLVRITGRQPINGFRLQLWPARELDVLLAKSPAPASPRHTPDDLAKLAGTAQGSLPAAKDARETERHNTLLRQLLEAARRNPELRRNPFRLHSLGKWYSEHFRPPLPADEVKDLADWVAEKSGAWDGPTEAFSQVQRARAREGHVVRRRKGKHHERNMAIRTAASMGMSNRELGRFYGLDESQVRRIKRGG